MVFPHLDLQLDPALGLIHGVEVQQTDRETEQGDSSVVLDMVVCHRSGAVRRHAIHHY